MPRVPRAGRSVGHRDLLALLVPLLLPPQLQAQPPVPSSAAACATSQAVQQIQAVGTALTSWVIDQVARRPLAGGDALALCPGSPPVDVSAVPLSTVVELRALLVPEYIAEIPEWDPWGRPYEYRLNSDLLAEAVLAVRSPGADGAFEGPLYPIATTDGPDDDVVYYNFSLIRRPPRLDPVSRQLATLGRVQSLGAAWLAWLTDQVSRADSSATARPRWSVGEPAVDLSLISPISQAQLTALLSPFYTPCVPALDGWENDFEYRLNDDLLGNQVMSMRSGGSDGLFEGDVYGLESFPPDDLFRDIVWSDGLMYRQPGGDRAGIFSDGFETGELWGTWSCAPDY